MKSNSGVQDFLIQVVAEFAQAFRPLSDAFLNEESFDGFLGQFGWKLETGANIQQVKDIFGNLPDIIGNIEPLTTNLLNALKNNQVPDLADFQQVITLVKSAINLINKINGNPLAVLEPFSKPEFQNTFPDEAMQYLVFRYLERRTPRLFGVLYLLGVFHEPEPDSTRPRPHYSPYRTNWQMLSVIFGNPQDVFKEAYGWGKADFGQSLQQGQEPGQRLLMIALFRLIDGFGIPAGLFPPSDPDLNRYYNSANPSRNTVPKVSAQLFRRVIVDETAHTIEFGQLNLVALPVPPHGQTGAPSAGLAVYPFLAGGFDITAIPLSDNVKISIKGGFESAGGIQVELYSDGASVSTSNPSAALDAVVRLLAERPTSAPWILVGRKDSTHLWLAKAHLTLQAKGPIQDVEAIIDAAADAAAFVLDFGEGDGFLNKIFGDDPQVINLATSIRWSSHRGLTIAGSLSPEINLALHQSIGDVIRLENLLIRLKAGDAIGNKPSPVLIQLAVSGRVTLGPVLGTVDRVGVQAALTFPESGGNMGPVNLALSFKPPDGLGFAIDANAVVGGGYLRFDNDNGQYGGVLQLEVKGGIAIKAIGLITTKMPDGSPGFSLLIIITVEFSPIQLGYGFTLNGVGGLAGFNRTMNVDALRDGIKNRALDSIMFPPDPIAHAQKIISDLQTVFPPALGRFVFAPMVKLGWGSGILIIEIGLVLELPSPLVLAIMGKLHLKLPPLKQGGDDSESKNVVEIHMDVLGILDFDRSEASVDAILYDSRLVVFPITGGMAMRLRWGSNPVFIISIGGFNPRFTPPPSFPLLDRLGLQLSYDKDSLHARLRLESYLAVTPNTLQFGARIDVYAELVSLATVAGFLGFDALIEFHPFYFIVDLYGGVSVAAFGLTFSVDLLLTLSGPTPFVGNGHATVNFLGKHEVPIHFIIGEEEPVPALPPVDPLDELTNALGDLRNWSAVLPAGSSMLVTLRQLSTAEMKDKVLAHPLGELTVRQKVLPFGIALERFGAAVPTTPGPFEIDRFKLGGTELPKIAPDRLDTLAIRDAFARGQFVNLSEDAKLSSPCFEPFRCGQTRIGTDAITHGTQMSAVFEYDVTIIDDKDAQLKRTSEKDKISLVSISDVSFMRAAQSGAAKQTPMASMGSAKFAGPVQGIKVHEPEYTIAGMDDMTTRGTHKFSTYTEAEAARRSGAIGEWQVVEVHEVT